jgi:hypothetical protein
VLNLINEGYADFYHIPFPWKGRDQHAVINLVIGRHSSLRLSCVGSYWSEQVDSRDVQTYRRTDTKLQCKRTAVQLIQAKCVHFKVCRYCLVVQQCTVVYT